MKHRTRHIILGLSASSIIFSQMANAFGPPKDVPLDPALNETVVMIKNNDLFKSNIQTTIFKPQGDGPFPLVIFNHGHSAGSGTMGHWQQRERSILFTIEMLKRGYAVALPMRKGYAGSDGVNPTDFLHQYEDVVAAYQYLVKQPYIDSTSIVMAGQSVGGYVSMHFSDKRNLVPNVKAIINFAGGLPVDQRTRFEDQLKPLSNPNNIPALWVYGANDFLTSEERLNNLEAIYRENNPKLTVVRIPNMSGVDGHYHPYVPEGVSYWATPMEAFLKANGLPSAAIHNVRLRATAKNDLEFLDQQGEQMALDHLKSKSTNQWSGFVKFKAIEMQPKSFAISTVNNAWGYASGNDLSDEKAIKICEIRGIKCKVFALNDSILKQAIAE